MTKVQFGIVPTLPAARRAGEARSESGNPHSGDGKGAGGTIGTPPVKR